MEANDAKPAEKVDIKKLAGLDIAKVAERLGVGAALCFSMWLYFSKQDAGKQEHIISRDDKNQEFIQNKFVEGQTKVVESLTNTGAKLDNAAKSMELVATEVRASAEKVDDLTDQQKALTGEWADVSARLKPLTNAVGEAAKSLNNAAQTMSVESVRQAENPP